MNKVEVKNFLEQSNPDIILGWYKNLATPEEKLFAASYMRNAINIATSEKNSPLNLMKDSPLGTIDSIMGIK